ncbi:flavoprotein [Rhodococcus sp. NPDC078407]|uniref:flavoprotein n=1 Tax=Rhodococcus sp. NPDC078407 TaxID=3364509 RepID=UPI0037CC3F28
MSAETADRTEKPTASGDLAGRNIVLVATGSIGTSLLPIWLPWLRHAADVNIRVVLTRAATRFVGTAAVHAFAGGSVRLDDWDACGDEAAHVEMNSWADAYLVHPATMNFVSRFAAGLCDSPYLLAMQGFTGPIVIAGAAPPGFVESPVWGQYERAIGARPNVRLLAPTEGFSTADPDNAGLPAVQFPLAVGALADAITQVAS